MAKVEYIIQALKNLGGEATFKDIYGEVVRISPSQTWPAKVKQIIEFHSSDTKMFKGVDYFRRVGNGIWAFRDGNQIFATPNVGRKIDRQRILPKKDSSRLTESYETISNTFKTIKEYRDYSNPNSSSWLDYVRELFHLLGFNTEKIDARLLILKNMGGNFALGLVTYVQPGEDFEYIVPGVSWESYLKFSANYYHINWGVLTNGLQIKVINFDEKNQAPFYWPNLDVIFREEKLDSFFEIYKIFSMLKKMRSTNKDITSVGPKSRAARPIRTRRDRNSDSMPKGLLNVLDVCNEMCLNGEDFNKACIKVAKYKKLKSFHTVGDACLRRIGLNTNGFRSLYADKQQLIEHLISYYPSYVDDITKALS
jgi:hypothetical protein